MATSCCRHKYCGVKIFLLTTFLPLYYVYTVINPSFMHIIISAAALTKQQKLEEALSDCQQAIKLNPNYAKAHARMG